jgi:hypothetical protein
LTRLEEIVKTTQEMIGIALAFEEEQQDQTE